MHCWQDNHQERVGKNIIFFNNANTPELFEVAKKTIEEGSPMGEVI